MVRSQFSALAAALSMLAGSLGASAPHLPPPGYQAVLDERVARLDGVGIVAAVVDGAHDVILRAGSSGSAVPLDEHTLFEIGSVTKTFTATLLATMVLDGSVKLDDPVQKYLPADVHVPERDGKAITLLDLATQHSGLPRLPTNMQPADPADPYADYSQDKLYAFLNGYTLPRDPGAQFEYSNLGVGLLGLALGNAAHQSYADLLRARVLAPLGMNETAIDLDPSLAGRFATGHDADGEPVKPWNLNILAGAGGLRSTAADMLKFVRCNLGMGPLAPACLFAQTPRADIPGGRIGLIWRTDPSGVIHHGGDTAGFHAEVALAPQRRAGVVVLSNGGLPVSDVAFRALDPAVAVAQPAALRQLDDAALDAYVADHAMTGALAGTTLTISRAGSKLMAQLSGQPAARIYPGEDDRFAYHVVNATIDFSRDAGGRVIGLVLRQNGQRFTGTKPGVSAAAVLAAQPSQPAAVQLPPSVLDSYTGTYVGGPSLRFVVTRDGNGLMVKLADQPAYPVYASSADHFFYHVVDAQLEFERASDGHVTDLLLRQNGRLLRATRQAAP